MEIINGKCNNCGAELTFDIDKEMIYCPYCGTKLIILEGDEVKATKAKYDAYRDVELAREETERERNRQEHEREKEKIEKGDNVKIEMERLKSERQREKERRRYERKMQRMQFRQNKKKSLTKEEKEGLMFIKLLAGLFALLIICLLMNEVAYVKTPEASKNCIGKQYNVVKQQFMDAGFSVRCEVVNDLYDRFLYKATDMIGTVKEISVNGQTRFSKGDQFGRFSPVVIYYHDYPES